MSLSFDHSICAVRSLDSGIQAFEKLGFVTSPGGTHSTGTYNAIVPMDRGYLEILSVYDEGLARKSRRHRAICDYLAGREGGLIGYALRTDNIDLDAERLASSGLTFEGPLEAERVQPDGNVLRWRVLRPTPQPSPATLPMIVSGDPSPTVAVNHRNTIVRARSISIGARSLDRLTDLYAKYLGVAVEASIDRPELNACQASITLDGFEIRLLAPMGPGSVDRAIADVGEGPFDLVLCASDIWQAAKIMGVDSGSMVNGRGFVLFPEPSLGLTMHIVPM